MASAVISQSLMDVVKTLTSQHDELDTVAVNMGVVGKSLAQRKHLLEEEAFTSELTSVNDSLYITVESMVKLKNIINGIKTLNNEIRNQAISAAEVEEAQTQLQGRVTEVFNSVSAPSVKEVQKHERFSKWNKLYKQCGGAQADGEEEEESDIGSDVELDAERDELPTRCPISFGPFTDPVYNKACNHIFDRPSVRALMGRKASIACPTAGCSKTVTMAGLVKHKELSLEIERKRDDEGEGAPTPTNRSARSRGGKSRSRNRGQVISDDDDDSE